MKSPTPDKYRHSAAYIIGMIYTGNTQFPEGWSYSKIPDRYYYKGTLVKRIDRGAGMVELVSLDEGTEGVSVIALGFIEAMKKMAEKL